MGAPQRGGVWQRPGARQRTTASAAAATTARGAAVSGEAGRAGVSHPCSAHARLRRQLLQGATNCPAGGRTGRTRTRLLPPKSLQSLCQSPSHTQAKDGECDDGSSAGEVQRSVVCDVGTDCSDCGDKSSKSAPRGNWCVRRAAHCRSLLACGAHPPPVLAPTPCAPAAQEGRGPRGAPALQARGPVHAQDIHLAVFPGARRPHACLLAARSRCGAPAD